MSHLQLQHPHHHPAVSSIRRNLSEFQPPAVRTLVTLTLKQPQLLTVDRVRGVCLSIGQEPSGGSPGSHRRWGALHFSGVKSSVPAGAVGVAAFGTLGGGRAAWDPARSSAPGIRDFSWLWRRDCGNGWRREPVDGQARPGLGVGVRWARTATATGAEGQSRGAWLTVSPTQDEAAAPGGRALRRDPGRDAPRAGPAQGERWAPPGRASSRTLHPVTCGLHLGPPPPLHDPACILANSPRTPQTLCHPCWVSQTKSYPIGSQTLAPHMRAASPTLCHSTVAP